MQSSGKKSKSETRQRQRVRHIRLDIAEDAALQSAADREGLSVTAYIRKRTLGRAGARSLRKRIDLAELGRLLAETGKIGSNVSQLARVANSNGEIWNELSEMRSALMKALRRGD